jgi:acid stress-induced BolA-like protein IbaG/YrbA
MTAEQLKERLESLAPGTRAEVTDLTGTQDHWQAVVVSPIFEGRLMIEQHRMVLALVDDEVQSNEVHALSLKTMTPAQYERRRNG